MLFQYFRDLHVGICSFLDVCSLVRLGQTHSSLKDVEKLAREIHNHLLPHLKHLGFKNRGRHTGLRRLAWHQLCLKYDCTNHSDPYGCRDWNDYNHIAKVLFNNNAKSKTLRRLCVYMNKFYDETVTWNWSIQKGSPFRVLEHPRFFF